MRDNLIVSVDYVYLKDGGTPRKNFNFYDYFPYSWYLAQQMKYLGILSLFIMLLGGCASDSSHLSMDHLKDPSGFKDRRRYLLEEIDMVERELKKINFRIQEARLLIKQHALVDENDQDGEIEKFSMDLSNYEYEKIDLLKELDGLKAKL